MGVVYVPDNWTYSLQDVVNIFGCAADLVACESNAGLAYRPYSAEVGLRDFRAAYTSITPDWATYAYFDASSVLYDGVDVFTISSTGAWTATKDRDWITVSPNNGTNGTEVTVYVSNNAGSNRNGTITFHCGAATSDFAVAQLRP